MKKVKNEGKTNCVLFTGYKNNEKSFENERKAYFRLHFIGEISPYIIITKSSLSNNVLFKISLINDKFNSSIYFFDSNFLYILYSQRSLTNDFVREFISIQFIESFQNTKVSLLKSILSKFSLCFGCEKEMLNETNLEYQKEQLKKSVEIYEKNKTVSEIIDNVLKNKK